MFDKNYTGLDAYAQSKLANILFNVELSKRLNGNKMCPMQHGRPQDFFQRGAEFFENFTTYMDAFL